MKSRAVIFLTVLIAACGTTTTPRPATSAAAAFRQRGAFVLTPRTVANALRSPKKEAWSAAAVNHDKQRGSSETYAAVAPAVVVVRTQTGHGSGFIVSPNGLVVTNNHVIADGMWNDRDRGASYAMVHLGTLGSDGVMALIDQPVRAYLLKHDPVKDLALLTIDAPPASLRPLPSLTLADRGPIPGMPISIVGHPSSGMLWTYRSGEVASVGYSPRDIVNVVLPMLAAADRGAAAPRVVTGGQQKIILTSAGVNPGDSGGPVVDSKNHVVAVTFAVPSREGEKVFSYHIHLDELRSFLEQVPSSPMFIEPDAWDLGPRATLVDLDQDGDPDALAAGNESIEEILFDLQKRTPADLRSDEHLADLIEGRAWRFDAAFRTAPGSAAAFYDTDGDGTIDLILVGDRDGESSSSAFTLRDGRWTYDETAPRALFAASYLRDEQRAQRLTTLMRAMK